jgi:hypothetical protein
MRLDHCAEKEGARNKRKKEERNDYYLFGDCSQARWHDGYFVDCWRFVIPTAGE